MDKENLNLVFISDNNFAIQTGVAIFSLLENRSLNCNYNIYIFCENIEQKYKDALLRMHSENFNIKLIDVENSFDEFNKDNLHVSTAAIYKFNIPNLLPDLDKVLYIDGDVLFNKDISNFIMETDITNVYAAVVADKQAEIFPSDFKKRLHIRHKKYFNSGMMLLNLKLMRLHNISKKLFNYRKTGVNYFMDQDALNVVFAEKVKYVSFNYNFTMSCWRHSSAKNLHEFYGLPLYETNYPKYFDDAVILHFSSPDKPCKYLDVPLADLWYSYYLKSTMQGFLPERTYLKAENPRHVYFTNPYLYTQETDRIDNPLISIIMPVYNTEKYLDNTLKSVVTQSLKYFELICIDDGSTDSSFDILKQYSSNDSRIKILRQENKFAGVARNRGIEYAKGRYIVFLDSDDQLMPNALIKMYQSAFNVDADVVLTKACFLNDKTKAVTSAEYCLRENLLPENEVFNYLDIPDYIFAITGGNPWGKVFKKEFILKNDIKFLPIKRSEDFYFVCMTLVKASRIATLKDSTVLYRTQTDTSLESTKDDSPTLFWNANLMLYNTLKEQGYYDTIKRSFLNDMLNRLSYNIKAVKTDYSVQKIYNIIKYDSKEFLNLDETNPNYYYFRDSYRFISKIYHTQSLAEYYLLSEISSLKTQIEVLQRKSDLEIHSKFNIKKIIMWLPRRIRAAIRCFKNNGFQYTMIRIFCGKKGIAKYCKKRKIL